MRTRLMLSTVCILILPFLFSTSDRPKLISASPFATIAYAGHTTSGNWCDCGTPGCLCDLGETAGNHSATPVSDNGTSDQRLSPISVPSSANADYGTGALILALALFLWARLRA